MAVIKSATYFRKLTESFRQWWKFSRYFNGSQQSFWLSTTCFLLFKLEYYGLSKSALKLLTSYLSNIKQCVKIEQSVSETLDIYKGVP